MPKYRLKNGQKKQPLVGYSERVVAGMTVRDNVDIEFCPDEVVDTDEIIMDDWVEYGVLERLYEVQEVVGLDSAYRYDSPYENTVTVDPVNVVEIPTKVVTSGFVQVGEIEIVEGELTVSTIDNQDEYAVVDALENANTDEITSVVTTGEIIENKEAEKEEPVIKKKRGRRARG